jgi:hypothetical protein
LFLCLISPSAHFQHRHQHQHQQPTSTTTTPLCVLFALANPPFVSPCFVRPMRMPIPTRIRQIV